MTTTKETLRQIIKGEYQFYGHKLYYSHRRFLLEMFPKNTIGAEIGVYAGDFAKMMLKIVNPKELVLIDPWEKIETFFGFLQNYTKMVRENETKLKAIKKTIEKAYEFGDVKNSYFDWVYLDTYHLLEETKNQLEICRRIVKKGGIISGDDYDSNRWPEVIQAVDEFANIYGFKLKTKEQQYWMINE